MLDDEGGWKLPFEKQPEFIMDEAQVLVGAVVVMAGTIVVDNTRHPALVFRFQDEQQNFLPPITLIMSEKHMKHVPSLVTEAVKAAIKESHK